MSLLETYLRELYAIPRDYTAEEANTAFGSATFDIYLNEIAFWRNIPTRVWEYTLGGYQVIKK